MSTTAFPFRLFLLVFLGWTFDFYDLVLLGFLKDAVGQTFGLTLASESWLVGVALGTSGIGGIVAGYAADRWGRRGVLATTIVLYSVGSLACGLAPTLGVVSRRTRPGRLGHWRGMGHWPRHAG